MFCNFCGKKIAPEDRVCPYCGQAQESRSGGNGFWDILTNPSAADDADPEPMRTVREPVRPMREPAPPMPAPPVPSDRRRKRTSRGILILSIITVVLLLGSIALDVVLFLNINKKASEINTKLEAISEALTEVNESTEALVPEATLSAPSEAKAPTEPASEPTTTASTGEPSETEGTSDPENMNDAANDKPSEARIITQPIVTAEKELTVMYEGVKVIWKYKDGSDWKEITPADERFKIDDETTKTSKLKIISEDINPYTEYMCVVKGADGKAVESESVKLTVSPNP